MIIYPLIFRLHTVTLNPDTPDAEKGSGPEMKRDYTVTLEDALYDGMRDEGRDLHRILAAALEMRGLPEPTYSRWPGCAPQCRIQHPVNQRFELALSFYWSDPVYVVDGADPQAILKIQKNPNMEDWLSLIMHGSGEDGRNRQRVTGPCNNNARPLYEAYLAGVEGMSAPFPRWKDQPLGYAHFTDREKGLTTAAWMVEHFFTLR